MVEEIDEPEPDGPPAAWMQAWDVPRELWSSPAAAWRHALEGSP